MGQKASLTSPVGSPLFLGVLARWAGGGVILGQATRISVDELLGTGSALGHFPPRELQSERGHSRVPVVLVQSPGPSSLATGLLVSVTPVRHLYIPISHLLSKGALRAHLCGLAGALRQVHPAGGMFSPPQASGVSAG